MPSAAAQFIWAAVFCAAKNSLWIGAFFLTCQKILDGFLNFLKENHKGLQHFL